LNPQVKVADLLRKALVVSNRLGVSEIDEWIQHELGGYQTIDQLPTYRRLQGELKVHNPYRGWQPVMIEDAKLFDLITTAQVGSAINEIEHQVHGKGVIHYPLPSKQKIALMDAAGLPGEPVLFLQESQLVGVLDAVRNTILKWALSLGDKGVVGEGVSFSPDERAAASQVTYQITNIIGSMSNSQLQQQSDGAKQTMITKGLDVEALKAVINAIEDAIGAAGLSGEVKAELTADLLTLRAQSESPKPKVSVVRESLQSIRTILEGAAGNLLAIGLGSQIGSLLSSLAI